MVPLRACTYIIQWEKKRRKEIAVGELWKMFLFSMMKSNAIVLNYINTLAQSLFAYLLSPIEQYNVFSANRLVHSQLRFLSHKFRRSTCNRQLACLLHLRLEDDLVALLPHLCDQCLAWQHRARKSYLDVSKRAVFLIDGFCGDAEETQAV